MKKIYLIILTICCVVISWSKVSNSYEREEYLLKEIKKDNSSSSMYDLGKLYESQKKYILAEKYYKLAIDNNSKDAIKALNNLYRKHEKIFSCIPVGFISETGKDIKTMGGNQNYAVGNYDLAEKCFKIAVAEDNNSEAMYMLGLIYYDNENYDLAEKYLKMSESNNQKEASYYLGNLYFTLENYDLAEKYYKQSLDDPNFGVMAMCDLGVLYFEVGEYLLSKNYLTLALDNRFYEPILEETLEKLKKLGY